jgi:hypothetical protein
MNRVLQLFRESLFSARAVVVFKVKSDKFGPRQVFLGCWWMHVRLKVCEVVLGGVLDNWRLGSSFRNGRSSHDAWYETERCLAGKY